MILILSIVHLERREIWRFSRDSGRFSRYILHRKGDWKEVFPRHLLWIDLNIHPRLSLLIGTVRPANLHRAGGTGVLGITFGELPTRLTEQTNHAAETDR